MPPYEERFTGCATCKRWTNDPRKRWDGSRCTDGCMWAQFDVFAHDCLALWKRCRRGVGKTEAGSIVWEVNYEALRAYLDTDGPLVAGHDPAEVLDGVLVVNGAKSAG